MSLSPREQEVATRWAHSGMLMQDVADELGISLHTAKGYMKIVRAKYKARGVLVNNRIRLHLALRRDGL